MKTVLITGSAGLIGSHLIDRLTDKFDIKCVDLRSTGENYGDVLDYVHMRDLIEGTDGIVHLAGVSRVIDAQRDPKKCWETNTVGLENILAYSKNLKSNPWIIFASSREVYGEPASLPVTEDFPLSAINIYSESKIRCEEMMEDAKKDGMRGQIVRFSNVFGGLDDYHDRVVPAFANAALQGSDLRVDGKNHTFDFTYIDDVIDGLQLLIDKLFDGNIFPPIHFVGGEKTTLDELAKMAIEISGNNSKINYAPTRDYDVEKFYGDFSRAKKLLGWSPKYTVREALEKFMREIKETKND